MAGIGIIIVTIAGCYSMYRSIKRSDKLDQIDRRVTKIDLDL